MEIHEICRKKRPLQCFEIVNQIKLLSANDFAYEFRKKDASYISYLSFEVTSIELKNYSKEEKINVKIAKRFALCAHSPSPPLNVKDVWALKWILREGRGIIGGL